LVVLFAKVAEPAEADQLFLGLVPQAEGEGFETGKERDGFYLLKQRIRAVTFLQIVIGDARA